MKLAIPGVLALSLIILSSGCHDLYEADPLHAAQADSSAAGYDIGAGRPDSTPAATRVASGVRTPAATPAPSGSSRGAETDRSSGGARRTPVVPVDTAKRASSNTQVAVAGSPRDSAGTGAADTGTRGNSDVATLPAELSAPAADSVVVNTFLSFNPSARTVWVDLIAGFDAANGALNFNGGFEGAHTLVVPVGWRVEARFLNRDRELSHSAIVVRAVDPIPMLAPPAAFPNAFTISLEEGIIEGRGDVVRFSADTEGRYVILCAVPGHGQSGMWVRLEVTRATAVPEYRRR